MKEAPRSLALIPVVAAAAFCGAMLYVTGKSLDYMFRDVNTERVDRKEFGELDVDPEDETE